jgi:ATP-dependent DNA helicase RecG
LFESLSAFANSTGGGVLLFGLDESSDFSIVGVDDAQRLQEDITHFASSEVEPALRSSFLVDELDDETVIAVEIDEIPTVRFRRWLSGLKPMC